MNEGAERIRKRILADAQAKAEEIKKEAEQLAAGIIDDSKKRAAKKQEQILERAKKEAEEHKRRIMGMAMLDARKEMLAAKQEMIERAFRQALDNLYNSDSLTYFSALGEMLLASIQTGDETVILSPRDKERVPAGFWMEINSKLIASGKKGNVGLAPETRDINGGFILSSDGVEINHSFTSLLSRNRDELEPLVAKLLFED